MTDDQESDKKQNFVKVRLKIIFGVNVQKEFKSPVWQWDSLSSPAVRLSVSYGITGTCIVIVHAQRHTILAQKQ